MASDQLALRAFNAVAVLHPFFKGVRLLFLTSGLQGAVMFPYHNASMLLLQSDTLRAQRALRTMAAPLESKGDFARFALLQAAALSVLFARRTDRFALLHVDLELLGREAALIVLGRFGRRSDQFASLGRRRRQLLR